MFKDAFSFNGRIRRKEYIVSQLLYYVGLLIISFFVSEADMPIVGFLFLPLAWFSLAQGAKRCHDRDNTGFFQIIPFYSIWMFFAPGDNGPNRFGPDPKQTAMEMHLI